MNDEQELGFDTEFMTDDEVEEMLYHIATTASDMSSTDNIRVDVINPYRIQHVLYTYKVMKYLTKGAKAKVTYALHEPYKSMGVVSVVGRDVQFRNTEWLMKAVELASNFEAYPRTDGTVQMNFTFHGLTTAIE